MSFVSSTAGLVLVDSRVNSGTIILPSAVTVNGRNIIFKDAFQTFATNSLTLSVQGGDTFEDGSITKVVTQNDGYTSLIANNGIWYQISGTNIIEQNVQRLDVSTITINQIPLSDSLGSVGYISTLSLESTISGLGTLGYISSIVPTAGGIFFIIPNFLKKPYINF